MRKEVSVGLAVLGVVVLASVFWFLSDDSSSEIQFSPEQTQYLSVPVSGVSSGVEGEFDENAVVSFENLNVVSVSFTGNAKVDSFEGYARIVAVASDGAEYLIFGSDSFGLVRTFETYDHCEETCNLEGVDLDSVRIEVNDAVLEIESLKVILDGAPNAQTISSPEDYSANQVQIKIDMWNDYILQEGLEWVADETSVSGLSYSEKKGLLGVGDGPLPNLQGFEYYSGGVFELRSGGFEGSRENVFGTVSDEDGQESLDSVPEEIDSVAGELPSEDLQSAELESGELVVSNPADKEIEGDKILGVNVRFSPPALPEAWDWRNVHGENWVTSVKNQGSCGSCWAFAVTGATELLVNLYYNQNINLDLSEQNVLSCSGAGNCRSGGWPQEASDWVAAQGIVEEGCFPYSVSDETCANRCGNPLELVRVGGRTQYPASEDELKYFIVKHGAVSGSVNSWNHAMVLIGYKADPDDGGSIWIFKNSWSSFWGEGGFAYVKTGFDDVRYSQALLPPIIEASARQIACNDNDNDGYCNWGITEQKPANCPSSCGGSDLKDCDDSDSSVHSGCAYSSQVCSDGMDNDGDGLIDYPEDPSCGSSSDDDEYLPWNEIDCVDSDRGLNFYEKGYGSGVYWYDERYVLNSPDGCYYRDDGVELVREKYCQDNRLRVHYQICSNGCVDGACVGSAACSDGRDNDGDYCVDLADPSCGSSFDLDEAPQDRGCSQCSDGIDNDGNGLIDMDDLGCSHWLDNVEEVQSVMFKDGSEKIVASFSELGDVIVGSCFISSNCVAPEDSFEFSNSNENVVGYVDSQGNLCLESGDCDAQSSSCSASSVFGVKNYFDETVVSISDSGSLCYTGRLIDRKL